jgi:DNA replication and repair protein RecF
MRIESLHPRAFRNLADEPVAFSPGVNLFAGRNGQGKTNLLEAVYCACYTKSFRTHRLEECARHGEAGFLLRCRVARAPLPRTLEVRLGAAGKELRLDDKAADVTDFLDTTAILCITASHLRVITEGPDQRRRFFDGLLVLFRPDYLHRLAAYRRVVRHRNALLRPGAAAAAALEPWDRKLVLAARALVHHRESFLAELGADALRDRFSPAAVAVRYAPSLAPELLADEEAAVAHLAGHRERELQTGRSLYGPHLDRFDFLLDGRNVRRYASSGQKRSVLLSLYLQVMDLYRQLRGAFPVVMIDDVDMELDLGRLGTLLGYLDEKTQIFLTSSKPEIFTPLLPACQVFRVESGAVHKA